MTVLFQSLTSRFSARVSIPNIRVLIAEAFDHNNPPPSPKFIEYNAIWDTGATNTVISNKVVQELGLTPVGRITTYTANGARDAMNYLVNILLPNNTGISGLRVTEGDLFGGIDGLIGMDIITMGDFSITNHDNKTCISFRMPSVATIDYVEEANKLNAAEASRQKIELGRQRKEQQRQFRNQIQKRHR